jgi:hypothetical protein
MEISKKKIIKKRKKKKKKRGKPEYDFERQLI